MSEISTLRPDTSIEDRLPAGDVEREPILQETIASVEEAYDC